METEAVYRAMLDARALLDSHADQRQGRGSGDRCIAFRVGDELYAVGLGAVREVILPPEIVPVPGADSDVLGVINLRGSVVTVINSRAVLGLGGCAEGPGARILIVDQDGSCAGALVDAVEDIILVDPEELEPVLCSRPNRPRVQVQGALCVADQIAFVIHAAALLGMAER